VSHRQHVGHPVKQILSKVVADISIPGQLKKKVIQPEMVPLKQDRHLCQISIFYPFHNYFIRNICHCLIFWFYIMVTCKGTNGYNEKRKYFARIVETEGRFLIPPPTGGFIRNDIFGY